MENLENFSIVGADGASLRTVCASSNCVTRLEAINFIWVSAGF